MKVKAKWTGRTYAHCIGRWSLSVNGKDVTDKIPEDLRTDCMNTYKEYDRWYFEGWVTNWESYYDGLKQDKWIESNKYWLDEITTDIEVQRQIFKEINKEDFRIHSCGGCI